MDSLGYNLLTPIEEGMEMLGVVLFINVLLGFMLAHTDAAKHVELRLIAEEDGEKDAA